MELHLFARFHARPGQRGAVERALLEVRGPTRAEAGCLAHDVFRSVRDPDELYVHSRWRDREAFEQHVALPHALRFVASVEPLLDHRLAVSLTARLG
jgi:quinol monooxygenase YgiN